jgi:Fe2+ transport system protein FeoA
LQIINNVKMTLIVYAMSVFDLKIGEFGRIAAVEVGGTAEQRLRFLGFEKGAKVQMLGFSFFNNCALVGVGSCRVALRRAVACKIEVVV